MSKSKIRSCVIQVILNVAGGITCIGTGASRIKCSVYPINDLQADTRCCITGGYCIGYLNTSSTGCNIVPVITVGVRISAECWAKIK